MKQSKQIEKLLKEIASTLPDSIYETLEMQQIKGDDVVQTGLKLLNNEEVIPEKIYEFKSPVYHTVNHFNRLKRAYKAKGIEGVNNYLDKIKSAIKQNEN